MGHTYNSELQRGSGVMRACAVRHYILNIYFISMYAASLTWRCLHPFWYHYNSINVNIFSYKNTFFSYFCNILVSFLSNQPSCRYMICFTISAYDAVVLGFCIVQHRIRINKHLPFCYTMCFVDHKSNKMYDINRQANHLPPKRVCEK